MELLVTAVLGIFFWTIIIIALIKAVKAIIRSIRKPVIKVYHYDHHVVSDNTAWPPPPVDNHIRRK